MKSYCLFNTYSRVLLILFLLLSCERRTPSAKVWNETILPYADGFNKITTYYSTLNGTLKREESINWTFARNFIEENNKKVLGFWVEKDIFYSPSSRFYYKRTKEGIYIPHAAKFSA
jgi:hypothetical protein